jgi:myo-inositol-1(or 4)-monophosphatase
MTAHELEVAEAAARAGGRAVLDGRHRLEVTRKHDDRANIVTSADLASQAAVTAVITEAFPGHAIVGEEGVAGSADSDHTWYVDPLDGTTNYVHGVPFWCVSVALRSTDRVLCGAVYDPVRDELYAAAHGGGATCNGAPLAVSDVDRLDRALLVVMAQSDDPAVIHEFARLYEHIMNVARGVRHLGSPALALCLVASGQLESYVERYMDPWDILAGKVILEEAGGRLTRFDGSPLDAAELADIVATNGLVHDELLAVLAAQTDEGAT